jgi:carbon monoxide dehydrogenase subunit G
LEAALLQLDNSFTVPVDPATAWLVLLDVARVAPCFPGAAIESVDGDDIVGMVKVKVGPIGLTYKGTATFVEKDEERRFVRITARGREVRGNGAATATVTAALTPHLGGTRVEVHSDIDLSGKPAQFGRGVIGDVAGKLVGQFADCLAGKLAASEYTTGADTDPEPLPAIDGDRVPQVTSPADAGQASNAEPAASVRAIPVEPASLNLISSVGPVLARRAAPYLIALAALLLAAARFRRSRSAD